MSVRAGNIIFVFLLYSTYQWNEQFLSVIVANNHSNQLMHCSPPLSPREQTRDTEKERERLGWGCRAIVGLRKGRQEKGEREREGARDEKIHTGGIGRIMVEYLVEYLVE